MDSTFLSLMSPLLHTENQSELYSACDRPSIFCRRDGVFKSCLGEHRCPGSSNSSGGSSCSHGHNEHNGHNNGASGREREYDGKESCTSNDGGPDGRNCSTNYIKPVKETNTESRCEWGCSGIKRTGSYPWGDGKEDFLIMAPPIYADLGKRARDVFNNGYHVGLFKLNLKTKTASGVEFTSGGTSEHESGKVFGSLETKYKISDYGLTFSEKWNTDNTLASEVAVQDLITKGLKVSFDCSFAPQTGSKSGTLKSIFLHERVALTADCKLNLAGPIINTSAVVGYKGWLAGYQTGFDSEKSKITKNNFAFGFSTGDFILHTNVDDGQEFGCSIFQKVSPKLDTGIQLNWSAADNNTRFGIACKYDLDSEASVRAKVNNVSQVGLGYQQRLREGITLTLSAQIDGKNFNSGGHKIGAALELEA